MANENNQFEYPPPIDGDDKRRSAYHLPKYFRTLTNTKFLSSTLDQLIQPGTAEKLNGYFGRKQAKGYTSGDFYIGDVSTDRENYQLEPAAVIQDELGNVNFYGDYTDYINQISNLEGNVSNHSLLNRQEYYAWNPHIDWDKIVNFRDYYWLPSGPQTVGVAGQTIEVESTYTVTEVNNNDNYGYVFTPNGVTQNPSLTLYRGITYKFEINAPNNPLSFRTRRENAPIWRSTRIYDLGDLVTYNGTIYSAVGKHKASATFEEDLSFWAIDTTFNLSTQVSQQGVSKGTIEVTLDAATPDIIYYVSDGDIYAGGMIKVRDIAEATFIDVENEILNKKTYTTSAGFALSNGMKVEFTGEVTPTKYGEGAWYVEGVGNKIKLISEEELNVPSAFTQDLLVEFDNEGFDRLPYSEALGYPINKDYITINRASPDGNLWSKYNRWFHKSVIELAEQINGQDPELDQSQRATRPIIEFEAGLKLFNFGTSVKRNVDLVDDFTTDVFSTIEGAEGYNVDGIDLTNGMRVVFTADTDPLVKGKIYEVRFIVHNNIRQITLQETDDTTPNENETLLCKQGETYTGKMFWFNGDTWKLAQTKTSVNQSPLFDVYDCEENSYADTTVYESSTFTGTHVFSYVEGSGANDSELGFPLSYRSIENVGDILFHFDLLTDSLTYCPFASNPEEMITGSGYLRRYTSRTEYSIVNGWEKADNLSNQSVIRQFVVDNTRTFYPIDVYDKSASLDDLWVRVYLNNKLLFENVDYILRNGPKNQTVVEFTNSLSKGDVIVLKTRSLAPKNENGLYEVPASLERNPLNKDITEFTLGEVNDHVGTIIEEVDEFSGLFPGTSNLRDLGPVSKYGKRIVKHSAPLNLPFYHLVNKDANLVKALKYARREYGKFKRLFLQIAYDLGFSGPVKEHVDKILIEMFKDKTKIMPFYFSDMVPFGAAVYNSIEIEDPDSIYFALTSVFDINTASDKSVEIYQNEVQLLHGKDYTFNDQGFAIITTEKAIGDIIEIYEYETTNGSFVPPTPTKLGLYPKYEPSKFIDDTYLESQEVIQGHDGSIIIAFGDYRDDLLLELEKRIYNNIKVTYDPNLFDIHDFVSGIYRTNEGLTRNHIDDSMLSDFVQWVQLTDEEYTANPTYDRENSFTYNHSNMTGPLGNAISGYWRSIYQEAYDTDRPHTHPWEMLGFTIKPTWWDEQYGEAPYTSNNLILWEDLETGTIRDPSGLPSINSKYARPGLTSHIPVDDDGNLLSPIESNYVKTFETTSLNADFKYGDWSPVETAWRRSSEYPFALLTSIFLNQPTRSIATGFDRLRQKRGLVGDIIYNSPNRQVRLEDLQFPNSVNASERTYTSGFVNYIYDYLASNVDATYSSYIENLQAINNQIGFKLAGFTSKDKFKLILDSRTPSNEGNVFVPEENYKIFLNKSVPVENVYYSGVIIEKQAQRFIVRGYNNDQPYFTYYPPLNIASDPLINVGGISENFVYWNSEKLYTRGMIVDYENTYYRATETHTSGTQFDGTKFTKLPALPLVGGHEAYFHKRFSKKSVTIPYGTVLDSIQDVVDFLLGYGHYLESQGFVFDYRITEDKLVSDWKTSAREFMFWTTQNWEAGAVISLSPGAFQLKFKSQYAIVDDIYDTFYGYKLLKADGKKLLPEFVSLTRENPQEFVIRTKITEDGIYAVRLSLVQKEHVVLIDNTTVFGDVIFDQEPGYRQERIRVLGYRTTDWDGSINIPGFIFDDAKITEWQPWQDYAIGDLVKYKEFYYSARNKISGTEVFDANEWVRLTDKPEMGLIPNFEYKINQFADFYDLDTDNFDVDQQKFAQHLIGYQNRKYLANIINDDVSQYKFYQGMIQDKGTRNALDKLFDVLSSADKDSLDFYEEWAIKVGQYGAADGFEEVEYILDESKMRLTPQSFELVNSITGDETDLVYRIRPYETYLRPADYDHAPFPATTVGTTYTKNSGYVNPENVDFILSTYDSILNVDFLNCDFGNTLWVGNDGLEWNVYTHVRTDLDIEEFLAIDGGAALILTSTPDYLIAGEIIGVYNVTNFNNGFYKISKVSGNRIEIESSVIGLSDESNAQGRITRFVDNRVSNVTVANTLLQTVEEGIDRIWIDDTGTGQWSVLDNTGRFAEHQVITNTDPGIDHNYGEALATDSKNTVLAVGAPDNGDGKVFIYTRAGNSGSYQLVQEIEPESGLAADLERFGASIAISPDGKFLAIGSPNASNVKTSYKGNWDPATDYAINEVVRYQDALWKAVEVVEGEEDNIIFDSYESVAQIVVDLNLDDSDDEQVPVILTGNYPFTNITTDHILLRAPKNMYEGTEVDDLVQVKWNTLSYAYQTQDTPTETEPFIGAISELSSSFFTGNLTIKDKIDAVLFVQETNTIPLVGQIVEVAGGFGTVAYTYNPSDESTVTAATTIYVKDINGTFGLQGSLTTSIGEYVGEYVTSAPTDTSVGLEDRFGGYWLIPTNAAYEVGTDTADEGRGLVYKDIITEVSDDSTDRYYHNILDYATTVVSSYDTRNSQLTTLTYDGQPYLVTDNYPDSRFVIRAPKSLTDNLTFGDKFRLFYNPLPVYEDGEWQTDTNYSTGQILKYVNDLFTNIYWRVKKDHTSDNESFLILNTATVDVDDDYTYDSEYYEPIDELPWNNPSEIGIPITTLNQEHEVSDLWDGYIDVYLTEPDPYDATNYVEPKVGLTVQDKTNLGTAEIVYYQRFDTFNTRIYVKGVSGTWAAGNLFGENREIEFVGVPSDPNILYRTTRVFGQIQSRSLGLASEDIGKLIVVDTGSNIPLTKPADAAATDEYYTILNHEYWLYDIADVYGIRREPSAPSENNNDWTQVYKVSASAIGEASLYENQGMFHIYERRGTGQFIKVDSYLVPEINDYKARGNLENLGDDFYLGSDLKFAKSGDFYRLFVKATGAGTQDSPGRIYVLKNGVENGYTYSWELGKDKEYKGEFSETRNYFENDIVYLDNQLYQALTNTSAGAFDEDDWSLIDGVRSYLGYVPNDTGLNAAGDSVGILVHDSSRLVDLDSSIIEQSNLTQFAKDFDVSGNGEVLIVSTVYDQIKNDRLAIYRNYNGHYELAQTIDAPSNDIEYGISVSISNDGTMIVVGAPEDDSVKLNHGKVFVYRQINQRFELVQELTCAEKQRTELFGFRVECDGNRLAVASKNGDAFTETSFDDNETTFDREFTKFRAYNRNSGTVHVYQRINDNLLFGQIVDFDDEDVRFFGRNLVLSNNHIYAGLPKLYYSATRQGTIVDYRIPDNTTIWSVLNSAKQTVDVNKIKRVMLYDTKTTELVQYLDYIDVLQGKIAGPAEQELTYKTYYDPATYTTGINVNVDETNSWDNRQIGQLWWDLTNAKFINPYQGNVIFSANNWNKQFANINTIDIYEWVESKYLPSEWDKLSGTENGINQGITGTTKYGDEAYVTKRVYDSVSGTFTTYFYYWVRNKTTIPNIEDRTLSAKDVADLIIDPAGQGYRFMSFISPTEFALYNCEPIIRGDDIALSIQYWTIDNQEINIHNRYQILTEGLDSSKPSRDIEAKWFDSLVGFDSANRQVPAPELSPKERYGVLNRPRQGWFVNRAEALKQVVDRVNGVLANTLLIDDKDITALVQRDEPPLLSSNRYDRTVDTLIELQFVGVAKARQAQLTPVVENGKIIRVDINDVGRGYLRAPTVTIIGTGQDAVITTEIDNNGSITNVTIENAGEYYTSSTRLSVRRYTVLVESDETLNGKWALYERDTDAKEWIRVESQAYDVSLYWNYIDWYATGYSAFTEIDHLIDNSYDLDSLNDTVGDIVKIKTVGTGGWLLLEKIAEQENTDYSVNYQTVGRENGTIKFKSTLYDTVESLVGYDVTSFDALTFDNLPSSETRIILETLRDDILVDELAVEYNKLFFASLRYVFAEQGYVDWAFKTSFVKAQHNVGELTQHVNFQNDNLPNYEDYIKEVKPYKTKIREYLSSYDKIDNSQSMVSDFDLPARYVSTEEGIQPQVVKVIDSEIVNQSAELDSYPNKNWADNLGFKVLRIELADAGSGYTNAPVIKITGSGTGATATASLGHGGQLSAINIVSQGSGYLSAPTVEINGNVAEGGREAKAVAIIGDSPVRSMHTIVKFDRVSGVYEFVSLDTTETFATTGNKIKFDLEWPMDLRTTRVAVYLNNDEVLGGQYTYSNLLDTSKGYDRYQGQILFVDPPVAGQELRVEYYKDINMLKAQDRINLAYEPTADQFGKTLGQLMDGVDYGGVEVRSFEFGGTTGWDSNPWFTQGWDIYDTTFEDEIFKLDGSTVSIELSNPLADGIEYNIYRLGYDSSNILVRNERMDDPEWDGSTIGTESNPAARMLPITGDGETTTIFLDELGIPTTVNTDEDLVVIIVRKSTSDGSFLPDPDSYDTQLSGGDIAYSTATGLSAADINIDGDGFVTPTTSKGPEEVVPGQVLDTVDITVYERPIGGTSEIISRNYYGDGVTKVFNIGTIPVKAENLFVKIGYTNLTTDDYTIDYATGQITFDTAPASNARISLITLGNSAANILDIDVFEGDGATVEFLTNARWEDDADAFVTVDGVATEVTLIRSDDSYDYPNNFIVKTPTPPKDGARISVMLTAGGETNVEYSQVSIDTFVADGSTTQFNFADSTGPIAQAPLQFYTVVKVNDTVLDAGYSQQFIITGSQREYQLDLAQIPIASLNYYDLEVYLNDRKLEYLQEWTFEGAGSFDSSLASDSQPGSTVTLERGIATAGDELKIFVMSSGEYRFGYYTDDNNFVDTPATIYFDNSYNDNDVITVYQFSNHDTQGIERYTVEVTEKTELTPGTNKYYEFRMLQKGMVALRIPARNAEYVWISVNGNLLSPSIDYSLTSNRRYVKLAEQPAEGDKIQVIHFADQIVTDKFGWRQFKDMLNRTHYKRLDDVYTLAEDLNWYDKSIEVVDATGLPEPEYDAKYPGVIFLDGERIEFFNRTGNTLNQIRRGTLGTGVKAVYDAGTQFIEQGVDTNMPYRDETETITVTADGTTSTFELPFDETLLNKRFGSAKDLIEVFVGGRRLRKDDVEVYNNEIAQDSTDGDETHTAEFSVSGSTLTLTDAPDIGVKVSIIRKLGKPWTDIGVPLSQADSDIARFLRDKTTDLPR